MTEIRNEKIFCDECWSQKQYCEECSAINALKETEDNIRGIK